MTSREVFVLACRWLGVGLGVLAVLLVAASPASAQTTAGQRDTGVVMKDVVASFGPQAHSAPLGMMDTVVASPVSAENARGVRGVGYRERAVGFSSRTHWEQRVFQAGTGTTRTPRERKVLGSVLGSLGGFLAGGLIGFALDQNCGCYEPGPHGFAAGAPIGAVAGGILGFVLASQ